MTSNICRANFNGGRTAQGNNRFQWDYGQILEISGIDNLPDPFVAQFSNTPVLGTAKSTVGTGGRVEIPNEYFVSGQSIYCFIVLHTGEDDGRTVYIATIPVTKRPKPIDDPITPTQQSTIDTAIAALQAGVSRAEGFAQTATEQAGIATEAATTATEAATRAEGAVADVEAAATRAETAADGAEASATAAGVSATDAESAKTAALAAKGAAETAAASAERSATDAGNYAGLAEEAEQDAQVAKTAAEASATAAAGSASAASGSATQAAQKASEASESATAAGTSATNAEAAKTGAETAQAAAETAQASAEEAAANAEQSAETAEWYAERVERFLPTDTASGEIASFPDGADGVPMQSVVVSMEPVQDLHGYDHPWPAGGGENLANKASVMPSGGVTAAVAEDGTITLNGTATTVTYVVGDFDCKDATATYTWAIFNTQAYTDGVEFSVRKADLTPAGGWARVNAVNKTFTFTPDAGSTPTLWRIQINTGTTFNQAQFKPMIVKCSTAPTAFAPYSNICPISGWDEGTVYATGVNVWDEEWEVGGWDVDSGTPTGSSDRIRSKNYISVKPNTQYYFASTFASSFFIQFLMFDASKTYLGRSVGYVAKYKGDVLTTASDCHYLMMGVAPTYGATYNNDISINYPATDTSYHAYQGDTISVTFPSEAGTVYGATLGVVSGELVVDRAMVDLVTLNWSRTTSYQNPIFYTDLENKKNPAQPLCSIFEFTGNFSGITSFLNASGNSTIGNCNANRQIYVREDSCDSVSAFVDFIRNQHIVYELATPITYHLSPQEVRTLLGTNNVWSDAGETAVTYKADVQLYIEKRISALS